MKKVLIAGLTAGAFLLSGCGSKTPQPAPQNQNQTMAECQIDGGAAPQWVCAPTDIKGYLSAVGSAQPNDANDFQFQREEAIAAARDALAKRISLKVKNMFKQFKATTGTGKDQTFDKATESVSKQVAAQTLNGSKLLKTWISPKGTMFVLVGLPEDQLQQDVKNAANNSFHNNPALYQKYLAKKSQEELDKAIEEEFGTPNQ